MVEVEVFFFAGMGMSERGSGETWNRKQQKRDIK